MVVLDEDYRVVEDGLASQARFAMRRNTSPLDGLPSSRSLFAPHYERAKRSGKTVDFVQYLDGRVVQVRIVPYARRLVVSCQTLCILDVLTLDGLHASLGSIIEALEEAEEKLRRQRARESLRVIEGGR